MTDALAAQPTGIHHLRLTVTDVVRSKEFYSRVFGADPVTDFTGEAGDPTVLQDPAKLFGGCVFLFGGQLLGLRPGAPTGDRFDPTRVGLDHVSLTVGSVDDLDHAAERLTAAAIEHGGVQVLGGGALAILSIQDPDDINLELCAVIAR
ncbi:MAG: VOC family protein, partial [Janthinobacterium lividum]